MRSLLWLKLFFLLIFLHCGKFINDVDHLEVEFLLPFEKNSDGKFYSSIDLFSKNEMAKIEEIKRIDLQRVAFEGTPSVKSAVLSAIEGEKAVKIASYNGIEFSISDIDFFPFLRKGRYLAFSLSIEGEEERETIDLKISLIITGTKAKND